MIFCVGMVIKILVFNVLVLVCIVLYVGYFGLGCIDVMGSCLIRIDEVFK